MSHLPTICPACNKEFKKGDDVVYCPECGAPYHRQCYKEQGTCMFEEKHGTGFEYNEPKKEPSKNGQATGPATSSSSFNNGNAKTTGGVTCPSCSKVNTPEAIFCIQCGKPLHHAGAAAQGSGFAGGGFAGNAFAPEANLVDTIAEIPYKDWKEYIGPSQESYLYRLSIMEKRKSKFGFMISAFFLGPFYFAYRKMWLWAVVTFLAFTITLVPTTLDIMLSTGNSLLAGISPTLIETVNEWILMANMIVQVVFGCFALTLYRRKGAKHMKNLRLKAKSDDEYATLLKTQGGVNKLAVVLVFALVFVLCMLVIKIVGIEAAAEYYGLTQGLYMNRLFA